MLFGVAAPTAGEIVINLLAVLSAADRAFGPCLTGGRTVTVRGLDVCCVTLAGAAVGAVAVVCPLAPVVAQDTVLTVAFLAGFACGAGGRFVSANVILPREVAILFESWA